jgi:lauroyl/myristoyl acyltransferase
MNLFNKITNFSLRYDILFPIYARLPISWAYRLATLQGRLFSRNKQAEKAAFMHHMRNTLTSKSDHDIGQMIRRHFGLVEREALDTWFIQHSQIHNTERLVNLDIVRQALTQQRPIILATGHYGRYWLTGSALNAAGYTTGALTRDDISENTYGLPEAEFRFRCHKLQTMQDIWKGAFVVDGKNMRDLYRALDKDLMVFLFDVPYAEARPTNISVPFLGKQGTFPTGIYRVAQKKNALIIPFFVDETDHTQPNIVFYPALDPQTQTQEILFGKLAQLLETRIYEHPEQWWLWPALPHLLDHSAP